MSVHPIRPFDDPRVQHKTAAVNGRTYKYLLAEPQDIRGTIFLIHGWPDCSMGWRYQIPMLWDLGLRVVCPDLMGFGGTDAPKVPPASLSLYGHKQAADDFAELARQLGVSKIIIGGHDWGGSVVYRCAMWHPELITHVFSVCTPYNIPSKEFVDLPQVVEKQPQFGYQIHLAGPEVEAKVTSKHDIRQFLNGMYGARAPDGAPIFSPERGILFDVLPKVGKSVLITDKEMDYYVEQYARNGLHGTLNWYRTREVNWKDELQLKTSKIEVPVLFIQANKDNVLLPSMAAGMERNIPNLTRREVNTGHWALWQDAKGVNKHIKEWLEQVVFGSSTKL